ncbi:MAG: bifunctional folylpolyglutamate synthase/dihydrofolate synthase [Clostridia bacterium]|nr:bifunctional folylpolyglutamate synthase/dihydrofolate synthase [Clostridia bacterium]
MTYQEALEKIHSLNKFGSRPGLDRVKRLLSDMGNPQDEVKYIHVAGTNGKGSVCAVISSVLKSAGYKTGLFISPFITDFCERIQINSTPIPHDKLSELTEYVFSFVEKLNKEDIIITEFEFVTAVCFEYFKREKVDLAVLETGLGGLLDCTNVIKQNLCSVITSISLDHTDILGETIEEIAEQKCGIIKDTCPVVSSEQIEKAARVIKNIAIRHNSPLLFSTDIKVNTVDESIDGTTLEFNGMNLELSLIGEHQVKNARTALATLAVLTKDADIKISKDAMLQGFKNAVNPARFEVLRKEPLIILDGAHNADGMLAFSKAVKKYTPNQKRVLLMGMLSDKDSLTSSEYIEGLFVSAFTVPVSNPRTRSAENMALILKKHLEDVTVCNTPFEGFDKAYEKAKKENAALIICGSLYLAGELRPYILKK